MATLPAIFDRLWSRVDLKDRAARGAIYEKCRGYSSARHWKFFRSVVERENIRSLCMLGVYFGRDIATLSWLLRKRGGSYRLAGVDLFADVAGTDWPDDKRGLTWQQAGFGPAPDQTTVMQNLKALGLAQNVELVADAAQHFLSNTDQRFDFIYIDVAHDYETTKECIELALARLNPGGMIAGDDFSNIGTWGVARAVDERFPDRRLFGQSIWWVCPRAGG